MLWELNAQEWLSSFGFICCMAYIMGWLANGLMQSSAFGQIGNWLLLLIGSYVSMYIFNLYGYKFHWYPLFTLACIAGGASGLFLFSCIAKRVLVR